MEAPDPVIDPPGPGPVQDGIGRRSPDRESMPESTIMHVATDGDDRWSGTLPCPNAAGDDGPLATVDRAAHLLRIARAKGDLWGPVEVVLQGGRYRREAPWQLGWADSGPVTWRSAPGERAVIDAGVPLPAWQVAGDGCWECDVRGLLDRQGPWRQLLVGGMRAEEARFPHDSVRRIDLVETTGAMTRLHRLRVAPELLAAAHPGCEAVILGLFTASRTTVTAIDRLRCELVFAEPVNCFGNGVDWHDEIYLTRLAVRPSQAGTWCLDAGSSRVIYRPAPGQEPGACAGMACPLITLLEIRGEIGGRQVGDTAFVDIDFANAGWHAKTGSRQSEPEIPAAVEIEGAERLRFAGCRWLDCGGTGLRLGASTWGCAVEGCRFSGLGGAGVVVGGSRSDEPWQRHRAGSPFPSAAELAASLAGLCGAHCIEDCLLEGLGRVHPAASGIVLTDAVDCRVCHNEVRDLGYTGISAGWTWGYWPQHCRGHLISGNHIHDLGQGRLSDMAGIYLLGPQPGTVVSGNHIHHVAKRLYGGFGINLDEGCSHAVIEGNLIHDVSSQCLHLHFGRENQVRGNVMAAGGEGIIGLSRGPAMVWQDKGGVGDDRAARGLVLTGNVLLADGQPVIVGALGDATGTAWSRTILAEANLWHDRHGACRFGDGVHGRSGVASLTRSGDFSEWQRLGQDRYGGEGLLDIELDQAGRFSWRRSPAGPAGELDVRGAGPRPADCRGRRSLLHRTVATASWP